MKWLLSLFFLLPSLTQAYELVTGFYYKNYNNLNYIYVPQSERFYSLGFADEVIAAQLNRLDSGDFLSLQVTKESESFLTVNWIESVGLQKFLGLWTTRGISLHVTSFDSATLHATKFNKLIPSGLKKNYTYSIVPGNENNEWVMFFSDQSDSYFVTAEINAKTIKISFFDNENGEKIESFEMNKSAKKTSINPP